MLYEVYNKSTCKLYATIAQKMGRKWNCMLKGLYMIREVV